MGLISNEDIIGKLLGFNSQGKGNQLDRLFPYEEGYITSSDVYSVTSKIAKGAKTIPWVLKKITGELEEVVESGRIYDIIQNPNQKQTLSEFVDLASLYFLMSGEAFAESNNTLGFEDQPTGVNLLNPQLIDFEVKALDNGKYVLESIRYNGYKNKLDLERIEHVKYANPTVIGEKYLRGLSPLVAGYLTLKGLNNNQEANASILENQGAAGILSNEGENVLTEAERKVEQSALDRLIAGVRSFGKVIQSGAKVKFTRLGLDPTQLKIIESKVMKFRDLCNVYDVKSILFNDPVNASFNNLTNAEKQYWVNAAIPTANLVVELFTKSIIDKYNSIEFPDGNGKYVIELDLKSIVALQADQEKEARKDKTKMEGVSIILNMPISQDAKIQLLVDDYGYSEENARIITQPIKNGDIDE